MLRDNVGMTAEGDREDCKPDYEGMIKANKDKLQKVIALKDSLFDYIGLSTPRGKLAEMVGELICEERQLEFSIENLIERQEKTS